MTRRPDPAALTPTAEAAHVLARWQERREEWRRLQVRVDGATIADEVLADLARLLRAGADRAYTLTEAASLSGYSADHLGRLVREGKLPNAGRANAPRIRARDLPRKAGPLPTGRAECSVEGTRGQIARSIVKPAA